jgi:RecJ-like exonuclease
MPEQTAGSPPARPPARWEEFLARARECREAVERMKSPLIVNHYDCDGLTSGAIAAAFLEGKKIPYRIKTIRKLDSALLDEIKGEKELIFTDLGGGSDGVQELPGEAVIFDHHPIAPKNARLQLNPHLFGIDGGTQMCGATTAYWSLRALPEAAIVGAVGDVQAPMQGPNRLLLEELQAAGVVEAPIDLKMYGRISRPLPQLLAYADDPYLPGLSGHEERCAQFLESLGKDFGKKDAAGWKTYSELDSDERKRLIGAMAVHIAEVNRGQFPASRLVGEVYLFPRFASTPELYEAGEFSTLMNACGRHEQPQLGIDICLGRAGALEKAPRCLHCTGGCCAREWNTRMRARAIGGPSFSLTAEA